MELLDDINKRGTTVVVVTHNKDIVNEMRKRVITLKKVWLSAMKNKVVI